MGMQHIRFGTRRVLGGIALAASCAFVAPAVAGAAPAPVMPLPADVPVVPGYEALAALAPALLDAAEQDAASPQSDLLMRAKVLLATAPLSDQAKRILTSIITFLDGSAGGGPDIPTDGPVIAQDAVFGQPTSYTSVPAGTWTLQAAANGAAPATTKVDLTAGGVYTLAVVDGTGGLGVQVVTDAAGAATMPVGGAQTGGGGTAGGLGADSSRAPWFAALGVLVAGLGVLALSRARTTRSS